MASCLSQRKSAARAGADLLTLSMIIEGPGINGVPEPWRPSVFVRVEEVTQHPPGGSSRPSNLVTMERGVVAVFERVASK